MTEPMTIEQVRDWHRKTARSWDNTQPRIKLHDIWKRQHLEMADALAAHIAKQLGAAPEPHAQPVVSEIIAELTQAVAKFPTWPTDPLHAVAVLNEECGELNKAALQQVYEPHKNKPDDVRKEALQTAAMAIRFLLSLDVYKFNACEQHAQRELSA